MAFKKHITLFFYVRTSNFRAEAEPRPNVLIFWRFQPEHVLKFSCRFCNANFPPIINPSEYKPLEKVL